MNYRRRGERPTNKTKQMKGTTAHTHTQIATVRCMVSIIKPLKVEEAGRCFGTLQPDQPITECLQRYIKASDWMNY